MHIEFLRKKISDYSQLIKMRLTLLVVFSASMAYLWVSNRNVDALTIWLLSIGGFLITAASNILNQIIEKDSDRLMKRTSSRPLPAKRMKSREAISLAVIFGVAGLVILYQINFPSALLGFFAMVIYAVVYTPLKKISYLTVIPGAIAGSLPVAIGAVAFEGTITSHALLLFGIQFIWQFPHTWSIAWLLNDEYEKAGLKMLPSNKKNKSTALLIMASTFLLIPACMLLHMYESAGIHVTWILFLFSVTLLVFAYRLYQHQSHKTAVALMLSCLAFLPLTLILLVIEKFMS
ncbi:MAG TPA: heme o synthase [Bacteroidia bacterium]|nr:heme o synthase [Bacteroidia bacterium]